jgi:hypothetical protein
VTIPVVPRLGIGDAVGIVLHGIERTAERGGEVRRDVGMGGFGSGVEHRHEDFRMSPLHGIAAVHGGVDPLLVPLQPIHRINGAPDDRVLGHGGRRDRAGVRDHLDLQVLDDVGNIRIGCGARREIRIGGDDHRTDFRQARDDRASGVGEALLRFRRNVLLIENDPQRQRSGDDVHGRKYGYTPALAL